jgi:hypothetical protein
MVSILSLFNIFLLVTIVCFLYDWGWHTWFADYRPFFRNVKDVVKLNYLRTDVNKKKFNWSNGSLLAYGFSYILSLGISYVVYFDNIDMFILDSSKFYFGIGCISLIVSFIVTITSEVETNC